MQLCSNVNSENEFKQPTIALIRNFNVELKKWMFMNKKRDGLIQKLWAQQQIVENEVKSSTG